jgi:hypothetical protein
MKVTRVLIDRSPFADRPRIDPAVPWIAVEMWPCRWISLSPPPVGPALVGYRCRFNLEKSRRFRLHVTADELYELFIDGQRAGTGPERGDAANWFFDTYDVQLSEGPHVIAAMVHQLGPLRPAASVSSSHGLLVAPEDPELCPFVGTGPAGWEAAELNGILPEALSVIPGDCFLIGPRYRIDCRGFPERWELSEGLAWSPLAAGSGGINGMALYPGRDLHLLRPSVLPDRRRSRCARFKVRRMSDGTGDSGAWERLLSGRGFLRIDAQTALQVLLDSQDYICANVELDLEGGRESRIELVWAELIRGADGKKGHRDAVEGPLLGIRDSLISDGTRRKVRMPVWRAGRYLEICVQTFEEPLVIHALEVLETGYPLDSVARWETRDTELNELLRVCQRTQEACAHDTYVDCPFYEQLQYIGDTRIQALITYCLTCDARLPKKAIELFLSSRANPSHLPLASAPSNGASIIPPFSLFLIGMVHDYAWWRGDANCVQSWLPALRSVLDLFLQLPRVCGLAKSPFGWNFLDASLSQIAPGGLPGEISGLLNWQIVLALRELSELEGRFGEPEFAARFRRHASALTAKLNEHLYCPAVGLYSDIPGQDQFSEHGQILPLLSGLLSPERQAQVLSGLIGPHAKKQAGAFFQFYLFEALAKCGRGDLILARLSPWRWAISQGFKAFPEYMRLDTRSDCHAWSAHPLHHYFASMLGIRPADWGFAKVRIAPQPGRLGELSGTMAHPFGEIRVSLSIQAEGFQANVALPSGLEGEFIFRGQRTLIGEGVQQIESTGK